MSILNTARLLCRLLLAVTPTSSGVDAYISLELFVICLQFWRQPPEGKEEGAAALAGVVTVPLNLGSLASAPQAEPVFVAKGAHSPSHRRLRLLRYWTLYCVTGAEECIA